MKRWIWIVGIVLPGLLAADDPKITADELLARHLASIGPPSLREAMTARTVEGRVRLENKGKKSDGKPDAAHIVSQGRKLRVSLPLDSSGYQGEDLAFDDAVPGLRTVARSKSGLADFLGGCRGAVDEGLLGGVLSASWPLLDLKSRGAQLKVLPPLEIEGWHLWRAEYTSGKFKARLSFDDKSFRHVRTIYLSCVTDLESAVEQFGSFRDIDGLSLPTVWTLAYQTFTITGVKGLGGPPAKRPYATWLWVFSADRFKHNPTLAPEVFTLGGPVPLLKK